MNADFSRQTRQVAPIAAVLGDHRIDHGNLGPQPNQSPRKIGTDEPHATRDEHTSPRKQTSEKFRFSHHSLANTPRAPACKFIYYTPSRPIPHPGSLTK